MQVVVGLVILLKILFNEKIPAVTTGENAIGYPGLYKSGLYTAVVSPATTNSNTAVVDSIDVNIAIGDVISSLNVSIVAIDQGTNTLTFFRSRIFVKQQDYKNIRS